ncbi:MAG: 7TM diverse intracellular signaling domain-containing protein [Burkholderiaceae bacterium]
MKALLRLVVLLLAAAGVQAAAPNLEAPLQGAAMVLVPRGSVTIDQVAAGQLNASFMPMTGNTAATNDSNELWLRIPLVNGSRAPALWQLQVQMPATDEVTLFEQRGRYWTDSMAGDRIETSRWPREGRHPRFVVGMQAGEGKVVYLRVRHAFTFPLAVRLLTDRQADEAQQREYLAFGSAMGAVLILVVVCIGNAVVYRNNAYAWFSLYAFILALALASFTGLAGQYFWGEWPQWSDPSKGALTLVAAGASVLFVRTLCKLNSRNHLLSRMALGAGMLIMLAAVVYGIQPAASVWLYLGGMISAAILPVAIALYTWRRDDRVGAWVLAAYLPLSAVCTLIVLRMMGLELFAFSGNTLASIALAATLPLLFIALNLRSRETQALQARGKELTSVDPLTGLLAAHIFQDRVASCVTRFRKYRTDAAIMHVRIANLDRIREVHGSAIADQCLIRAAIKLGRVMGGADAMGRVEEAGFGLIFELPEPRQQITEKAAHLVAQGLMPLKGLKPQTSLQFHIVVNVLSENPVGVVEMQAEMLNTLKNMSGRTRRPIRFLEDKFSATLQHAEAGETVGEGELTAPQPVG